ncbi:hypothetical protein ACL03H_01445 [Saccharopolyspora sp. MS10]|uniref:hypothetical protein n=1 Tax=Saccharopolyspora sp. MS10 TaxID=3385973 RepID=UPI0039A13411
MIARTARRLSCRADEDLAGRVAGEGIAASRIADRVAACGMCPAQSVLRRSSAGLRGLRRHEVPLLFGLDARIPIARHGDPVSTLELSGHIGTHADIIQLATTSACFLGLGETTGELRLGLEADGVVDGDPLRDVRSSRHPRRVLRAGREPDEERLVVSRCRWAGIRGGLLR